MKNHLENALEQSMTTPTTSALYDVQEDAETSLTSADGADYSNNDSSQGDNTVTMRENRLVSYSKLVVLLVIVAVAAGMGFIAYAFVKEKENSEYLGQFHEVSSALADTSQARAREIYQNLEAFSAVLTTFATNANAKWPFVVFPDFSVHGLVSNMITGASTLTLVPIVTHKDRQQWESFSANTSMQWLSEGHAFDDEVNEALYVDTRYNTSRSGELAPESMRWDVAGASPVIWNFDNGAGVPVADADVYYPAWQVAPCPDYAPFANIDLNSAGYFERVIEGMLETDSPVLTEIGDAWVLDYGYDRRFTPTEMEEPHSYLMQPVYDSLKKDREIVAILLAFFRWGNFFERVIPAYQKGITIVVYGTCNQTFSYDMVNGNPTFLGNEDFHDPRYDEMGEDFDIAPFNLAQTADKKYCQYTVRIFPSEAFENQHLTNDPYYFAVAVIACFAVTTMVFALYDCFVTKRLRRLTDKANRTTKIVNAMYPASVRQRLMNEASSSESQLGGRLPFRSKKGGNCETSDDGSVFGSKPIADLFPDATILFADLVGFTAWSSVREPTQVFQLLETIYHKFDTIAKRMRVFKVETIGDCYVAVCGLPMKRKDHCVVMARFASECLNSMHSLLQSLECTLGPDTTTLAIRAGLHTGPVTAGVLRGDKGRFQLFGDSVNTASRMESTGERGKIQVSEETAKLLMAVGKERWLTEREDQVHAKGKGLLRTYWLRVVDGSIASRSSIGSATSPTYIPRLSRMKGSVALVSKSEERASRAERLVLWNVELLGKHLKEILAQRASVPKGFGRRVSKSGIAADTYGDNFLGEVKEVLELPQFNSTVNGQQVDPSSILLSTEVQKQLTDYVRTIASLYRDNPFHNWDHASHVTMSVTKLMGRIVHPSEIMETEDHAFAATFQDPMIQFSCVLSGIVHDVDHSGLSNATLVQEEHELALKYEAKSVAEQNSLDLCWKLLMQPAYQALQAAIFDNQQDELDRFRSILVQCVLATDICDKDLGAKRKERWAKAFAGDSNILESSTSSSLPLANEGPDSSQLTTINRRKATIVLEHLIQASDVSHTMQHWHIYRKWNQRLFEEVYGSFLDGHIKADPSVAWYAGEIGFFDFYIIPLANKLETCGVFGVSSTEYKGYAEENRQEWELKGEGLVKEYIATAIQKRATAQEEEEILDDEEAWTPLGEASASAWV